MQLEDPVGSESLVSALLLSALLKFSFHVQQGTESARRRRIHSSRVSSGLALWLISDRRNLVF